MANKRLVSSPSITGDWPSGPGPYSVAVRLGSRTKQRVVIGNGMIDRDPELGKVFAITFAQSGEKLLVAMSSGCNLPQSGAVFGCDYLICLN